MKEKDLKESKSKMELDREQCIGEVLDVVGKYVDQGRLPPFQMDELIQEFFIMSTAMSYKEEAVEDAMKRLYENSLHLYRELKKRGTFDCLKK